MRHYIAPDGDTLYLYYGAADSTIALTTGNIRAILEWLEQDRSKTHGNDQLKEGEFMETFEKRQKEAIRREKKQKKAARRMERRSEKTGPEEQPPRGKSADS